MRMMMTYPCRSDRQHSITLLSNAFSYIYIDADHYVISLSLYAVFRSHPLSLHSYLFRLPSDAVLSFGALALFVEHQKS